MPGMPTNCESSPGNAPKPISVLVTGAPSAAREFDKIGRGVGQNHAAAGINHRPLRAFDKRQRALDLPRMAFGRRAIRAQFNIARILILGFLHRHIFRDIDQNRPPAAR